MKLLPWRVKALLSDRAPLLYHLAINFGAKANSQSYWDQRLADTWHQRTWPTKIEMIVDRTSSSDIILDIGCGTGSILRGLQSRGYQSLHGLEISRYAVQRLHDEGFKMHLGCAPLLPMADATYDVVIASQLLEHVIRRRRFVLEIARILKDQGKAFIFVPDNCLGPIDEAEHVIKYNQYSLRRFLARYFDIVEISSFKDQNFSMSILFAHVQKKTAIKQRML